MNIISFDLDGTLVTEEFSRSVWHQGVPELYAQRYACDLDGAQKRILEEYSMVGDDALEWYDIHYWLRYFNLDGNWKALLGKFTPCIKTYPEVHEILSQLSRRCQLIITSNAAREFLDLEIGQSGLAPYFSHIYSATSDFRTVKKNPQLYLKILSLLNIHHTQFIHVGDHYHFDYLIPSELGIKSFYLDRSATRPGPCMVSNLREFVNKV